MRKRHKVFSRSFAKSAIKKTILPPIILKRRKTCGNLGNFHANDN